MTPKSWFMVFLTVVLFAVYAVYFTDWFKPKTLLISHTYRNIHPGPARSGMLRPLVFGINREARLTDVRLVSDDDFKTNKYPVSLWHLVSDSNSVPVKAFFYGEYIRGMRPDIKGERAKDLDTNVMYRLIVTAGKYKGDHEFELK